MIGCDNFNPYYSPFLKKKRASLLKNMGVEVVECDICHQRAFLSLFSRCRPSHCVHLAAQAGVRYAKKNPHVYVQTNLEGTLSVLEACRENQPSSLLFASSSSVYGNPPKNRPSREDDATDAPLSLYAATKKGGEVLLKSYHSLYGIPSTILRFFTCYGPWGRPDMACFSFASKIASNQTIPLFNKGQMDRDFTYIDDLIQGIVAAIDQPRQGYNIYNLGRGKKTPLVSLVSALEKSLGLSAKIENHPMQQEDPLNTWANIERARRDLQFDPTTELEEGVEQFCKWYLEIKSELGDSAVEQQVKSVDLVS